MSKVIDQDHKWQNKTRQYHKVLWKIEEEFLYLKQKLLSIISDALNLHADLIILVTSI